MPHPVTTPSVRGPVLFDAEAVRAVAREHVELDERAGVEQQVDALAGGELALVVLAPDRRFRPGVQRLFLQLPELLETLGDRVRLGRGGRGNRVVSHAARLGPGRGCGLLLDELDQRAERGLRVHERDRRAAASGPGLLVNHAVAAGLHRRERLRAVVDAGSRRDESLRPSCRDTSRPSSRDGSASTAGCRSRRPSAGPPSTPSRSTTSRCSTLASERVAVEVDRRLEVAHCDGDVVDLGQQHAPSSAKRRGL